MSSERRYKLIDRGLPGQSAFNVRDVQEGDRIRWDSTLGTHGKWVLATANQDCCLPLCSGVGYEDDSYYEAILAMSSTGMWILDDLTGSTPDFFDYTGGGNPLTIQSGSGVITKELPPLIDDGRTSTSFNNVSGGTGARINSSAVVPDGGINVFSIIVQSRVAGTRPNGPLFKWTPRTDSQDYRLELAGDGTATFTGPYHTGTTNALHVWNSSAGWFPDDDEPHVVTIIVDESTPASRPVTLLLDYQVSVLGSGTTIPGPPQILGPTNPPFFEIMSAGDGRAQYAFASFGTPDLQHLLTEFERNFVGAPATFDPQMGDILEWTGTVWCPSQRVNWRFDGWVSGNTYRIQDMVRHNSRVMVANKITTEEPSLSATDWDLVVDA